MSSAFSRLAQAVAGQKTSAAIEKFLLELLTPGEVHDLQLRWELVELLVEGVSQRQIASRLGISLCKITRGAKILKKKNGAVVGLFARKTSAAAPAQKPSAKKSSPKRPSARKTAPDASGKPSSAGKSVAKKPAKPGKKVVAQHGTRISGKSKNQVRR